MYPIDGPPYGTRYPIYPARHPEVPELSASLPPPAYIVTFLVAVTLMIAIVIVSVAIGVSR